MIQVKKAVQSRNNKVAILAEGFVDAQKGLEEYYVCLLGKCDPLEQEIIVTLREKMEDYMRAIMELYVEGLSIEEALQLYNMEGGAC